MLFLRIDTTDSLECFIWEGGMERGKEGGWILCILGTSNPIHPSTSACSPMGSLMVGSANTFCYPASHYLHTVLSSQLLRKMSQPYLPG